LHALIAFSLFAGTAAAQTPAPAPPEAAVGAAKVDGLELPADIQANIDDGFVNISAKCDGQVKWLVLGQIKVKYIEVPGNQIIVAVPPHSGMTVTVFAVGMVKGKLTEFAQTNITVKGNPAPAPGPAPGPGPQPPGPGGPFHVTMVVDMSAANPQTAQLLNSQNVRNAISAKGNFLRIYDAKSPVLATKKLDGVVQQAGGAPAVVIQRNDGFVIGKWRLPATEQELIQLIQQNTGG
jgi:hypothetical protein